MIKAKGKIKIRPITQKDIDFFYKENPPYSFRGWVGEIGGIVFAMGGYWITPDACTCVLYPREDVQVSKLTLWRGIRQVFDDHIVPSTKRKLVAIQDKCEHNSHNLLTKLGFIPAYKTTEQDQVFVYVGKGV